MEGKDGESYPSLDRLVEYTGLNLHTVTDCRKWLRANGWLTSSGQKHTAQGKFSIPIEQTTIPEPVGGKTTNGGASGNTVSGKTACSKTTNGAGGKTTNGAGGKTACGKPTTEVDPKSFEVDPQQVDPRGGDAGANAKPKPAPLPNSGLKGNTKTGSVGQGKPSVARFTPDRAVNFIIEKALSHNDAASFTGKSKRELREALVELSNQFTLNDLLDDFDAVIRWKISNCDDFQLRNFGSILAAELVASVSNHRAKIVVAKKKAAAEKWWNKWQEDFESVRNDLSVDLDVWEQTHHVPEGVDEFGYHQQADELLQGVKEQREQES